MSTERAIRDYYDALRSGDSLVPFFRENENLVKCGISERLVGYEQVAEGLREQTETTSDWTIESRDLRVRECESAAWFADEVRMAWTTDEGKEHDFETRWSGTLERSGEEWKFVGMHVSVAREL
jgi:ketosteroid isomerase-like protein